ncbi:MAG: CBS domain-containing protein [Alicyclobacillus sp.]|nr:CBS domain-containing protein [Alicyclobacillus sp.]
MATKQERIVHHIAQLPVGSRISVRRIAREMHVSEGTAYRAIKEAEARGLVSAVDRIGTVRIEQPERRHIEQLTFAEVVNIVDGSVQGGHAGLHKTLSKFVIGAMQVEAAVRYIQPGSLMLVGNREGIQRIALEHGAAVLVTGGFSAPEDVRRLADRRELPIITCSYDTFTTASLINRAIYDRLIKKDIVLVEDVATQGPLATLQKGQPVSDYFTLVEETGHAKIPIVDDRGRLAGIVTARDVADVPADRPVDLYMTRQPFTVTPKTPIASAAHQMVWEGVELMPVVENRKLVGVISRQDVIKALQLMSRQPHMAETVEGTVLQGFEEVTADDGGVALVGHVGPPLTGPGGTLSLGALCTLMENCAVLTVHRQRKADVVPENITLYALKPIPIDASLEVRGRVMDFGHRFAKVEVEAVAGGQLVAKALLTTQTLER